MIKDIRALELSPGLIIHIENDANLRLRRHLALQHSISRFQEITWKSPLYARFQSV